jgi:hypothetical protein
MPVRRTLKDDAYPPARMLWAPPLRANLPQQQVFDQCRHILEHNFNHMISTDWYSEYFKRPFDNFFLV